MTRRLLAALSAAVLALGCVPACGPAESQARPDPGRARARPSPAAGPPLRVMPLGDSITEGMGVPGGYRTDLWQMMAAGGPRADFVGSQSSGPAQLPDRAHEGHPGWEIGQLDAHVRTWVAAYRPDVVLLHMGTNDLLHGKTAGAPDRLATLIRHITAASPGTWVYVATLVPLTGGHRLGAARRAFNRALPGLVGTLTAGGNRVRLVPMRSALTRADISRDGIHPTNGGQSKIAARWYSALSSAPTSRWEAESTRYARVVDGERLRTAAASGGAKVGYLDNPQSYVEFRVTVPAAGAYRMFVRAANGMATPCDQRLLVNGRLTGQIRYIDYGFEHWTVSAATLRLAAGANTLRLQHLTCSAEIDAIDLSPRP